MTTDSRVSMSLQNEIRVEEVAIIELTFLGPLPKECRCLLCEQLMRDPCHVSCCNSRYCQKCVDRLIASKHHCVNPKCHSKYIWKETSREDEAMKSIIETILVYCPMKICGCLWTGKIRDLEAHLHWGDFDANETTECRFLPVPCPNQCGGTIPRRDMEEHRQTECDKRYINCLFCGYRDVAGVVTIMHQPSCPLRVVDCPSGCGMPGIKETNLSHHLKEECPLRLVMCEHIGCGERVTFKDRSEHNKQNFHTHFELMSEKVVALTHENEELRSLALSVQNACNTLQQQYSVLLELMIRRDVDENEEDTYLLMNRPNTIAPSPPPIPTRGDKPPIVHSRTDSMREALQGDNGTPWNVPPRNDAPVFPSTRRPVSFKPPRFSELVSTSLSSPDSAEVSSWNVLPLPPMTGTQTSKPIPPSPPTSSPPPSLPLVLPLSPSPPSLPPLPPLSPPSPPVLPPSPSSTGRQELKKPPPSPPPRRDSLPTASYQRPSKMIPPPVKPKLQSSLPNLLQEEQGVSDYQRRSRTWSTSSAQSENPNYTRNSSTSQRYETSRGLGRISTSSDALSTPLSGDDVCRSYESKLRTESDASSGDIVQYSGSYESTLRADSDAAFLRNCRSAVMDRGDESKIASHSLQGSKSSDSVYVNTKFVNNANTANSKSIGNPTDWTETTTNQETRQYYNTVVGSRGMIAANPAYVRSPPASSEHLARLEEVFRHTLVVDGQ